jgi:isopenicillin N synthase-like dioxygenase
LGSTGLIKSAPMATNSLPVIDISPFLDPSSDSSIRQRTAQSIANACQEFGFFYLTGHGIPTSTLDSIIDLARQFFALPLATKNRIKRYDAETAEGGDGARGYQGMGENVTGGKKDMHEAVDLYREWEHLGDKKVDAYDKSGRHATLQGPNLWPTQPPELKETYLAYIDQLQAVGKSLVRAMGVALDLPSPKYNVGESTEDSDIFVRKTDCSFWVMRLIGYPKLDTPLTEDASETEFSCGEHTDYGCVTLLLADPTPGALQVLLKDGKTWLNADPVPGAFVVNIGDMYAHTLAIQREKLAIYLHGY